MLKKYFYILLSLIPFCVSELYFTDTNYNGEYFSDEYLHPEVTLPTRDNLQNYLMGLEKTVFLLHNWKNDTYQDVCLCSFYLKSILKRTMRDYGNKLAKEDTNQIRRVINYGDDVLSHCLYPIKVSEELKELLYNKVMALFRHDDAQVYSIEDFNKHKLQHWLKSNISVNYLAKRMDTLNITRLEFIEIVHIQENSFLTVETSDLCLSRIIKNPEPTDFSKLRKCKEDLHCHRAMHTSPSVSYYLSHRLFYLILLRHTRRCYIISEELDDAHFDVLCASMYRETIYIARKGFFCRDLFLEHVAICAMLGYLEFHRVNWFNKIASWQDSRGCVPENYNMHINRTLLEDEYDRENVNGGKRPVKSPKSYEKCHVHVMSLFVVAMAHGVRYAAYGVANQNASVAVDV